MAGINFFFKRKEFCNPEIKQPYYDYLGYYREGKLKDYPVTLYFGKREVLFFYSQANGLTHKIFSFYVADGEINQSMLSNKIQNYFIMPLWTLGEDDELAKKVGLDKLYVDSKLLSFGFFLPYHGISFSKEGFYNKIEIPGSRNDIIEFRNKCNVEFCYTQINLNEAKRDNWYYDKEKIKPQKINFTRLLLDFLFELDFANTFEDENFYILQPHIQNNYVLDALTKKCRYLSELYKKIEYNKYNMPFQNDELFPKSYQDIEKDWLNVCCLEKYKTVFENSHSLFYSPEDEIKNVLFKSKICNKKRIQYMSNEEYSKLKNEISSFFMCKYNITCAYGTLLSSYLNNKFSSFLSNQSCFLIFLICLLFIPLGDFFFSDFYYYPIGFSSYICPLLLFFYIICFYCSKNINLFKLLLPRLLFGIIMGWSFFWSVDGLWKKAIRENFITIIICDIALLIIIFMYIYTDIENNTIYNIDKQSKKKYISQNIFKTFCLISSALVMSFVVGFYVIQFNAKQMIENSGFLTNNSLYKNESLIQNKETMTIENFYSQNNLNLKDGIRYFIPKDSYFFSDGVNNFCIIHVSSPFDFIKKLFQKLGYSELKAEDIVNSDLHEIKILSIIYMWTVLFSQFVISIFLGIILQMLWIDRPITEPL